MYVCKCMCTSLLQIPLSLEENVESLKIGVPWVYMPPDMGVYGTSPLEEEKVLLDDESSLLPSSKSLKKEWQSYAHQITFH